MHTSLRNFYIRSESHKAISKRNYCFYVPDKHHTSVCSHPRPLTYIQHSHWSSYYNTALSLVESFRMVKYFHALKGPIIDALSDATSAILCHKEPARRKNEPYFLLLAGSLCQG